MSEDLFQYYDQNNFNRGLRTQETQEPLLTLGYHHEWGPGMHTLVLAGRLADFPVFDQAITALVEDLHQRGLDKDCTVLVWGEFGRTPRISPQVGRDHWPRVAMALLAGGGMRNGQIIGSTDRLGGEANSRPVTFPEVFATLYHNLGIDVDTATVVDAKGRPHYLVEGNVQPIRELV